MLKCIRRFVIDSLGINSSSKPYMSADEEIAETLLKSLSRFVGDRYEAGLLWRYDNVCLSKSRLMALRRHRSLEKRMANDPQVLQPRLRQIIPRTKFSSILATQGSCPVNNPNKPGNLRIVWDAAAKVQGVTLNSILLKGPHLLCSLHDILLSVRQHPVTVTGNFLEMSHQINIRRENQKYKWA